MGEKTELKAEGAVVFVNALLNPPEPNAALRAAADRYREALRRQSLGGSSYPILVEAQEAAGLVAAIDALAQPTPQDQGSLPDEITETSIRSRAKALILKNGWKPGDRPGLHSVVELMTAIGMHVVGQPPTDRCAYPECGCDFDATCANAPPSVHAEKG